MFYGHVFWSNRGDTVGIILSGVEGSIIMKKKFKIDGMHCTSCALSIDMDVEDLEGVKESKTSYAKGETEVEFNPDKVNEEQIVEVIQKLGYQASPVVH